MPHPGRAHQCPWGPGPQGPPANGHVGTLCGWGKASCLAAGPQPTSFSTVSPSARQLLPSSPQRPQTFPAAARVKPMQPERGAHGLGNSASLLSFWVPATFCRWHFCSGSTRLSAAPLRDTSAQRRAADEAPSEDPALPASVSIRVCGWLWCHRAPAHAVPH